MSDRGLKQRVIAFVEANPGRTSREIAVAMNERNAKQGVASTLAYLRDNRIIRAEGEPQRFFPRTAT